MMSATVLDSPITHLSRRTSLRLGGQKFDWVVTVLSSWLVAGFYLDGWAHHNIGLESFFTPWHGVLYSGFLASAAWLVLSMVRNHATGLAWRRALPAGYGLSLIGVVIFLAGGFGDLAWHVAFGVEVDIEALLSPTHLVLAVGGLLIMTGPLRAAWLRPGTRAGATWLARLPSLLSASYALAALFTFTEYANAFASPWPGAAHTTQPADYGQSLGVAAILMQTVLLFGFVLVLLRRWTLPLGSLTVLFTLSGTLAVIPHSQYVFVPVALASGMVADVLYQWLSPREDRPAAFRMFAVATAVATFGLYFLALGLSGGTGWSIHLWTGSIVLAGAMALLLSYVAVPPRTPA